MNHTILLDEVTEAELPVRKYLLCHNNNSICVNCIAIHSYLSIIEEACVFAEEPGHYDISVGGIIDQSYIANRKQERQPLLWG